MAPEIVQRLEYEGRSTDMWSMGILLYALLCGCFPFRAKSYPDLYRRIARGTFQIPDELSMSAKDLIRQLLMVDPLQRMTASAAMRHPWLARQLAASADMNKLRLETTILISDRAVDDVDDQVIGELEIYGFPKQEIVQLVLTKTHSSIATLYYLLMNYIITKRKQSGGPRRPTSSMNSSSSSSSSGHYGYAGAGGNKYNPNAYGTGNTVTPGSAQFGNTTNVRPSSAYAGSAGSRHVNPYYNANYQYAQQQQQQTVVQQQYGAAPGPQDGRQEYVGSSGLGNSASSNRPRSASAGRPIITGPQRPLSAYLGKS